MTKDTEKAFKILYCEFKQRRKSGASKPAAMEFDAQEIRNLDAFQKWLPEDIDYALQELKTANYVKYFITGGCELTETGLEFMESKPKDFFSELAGLFDLLSLFC